MKKDTITGNSKLRVKDKLDIFIGKNQQTNIPKSKQPRSDGWKEGKRTYKQHQYFGEKKAM